MRSLINTQDYSAKENILIHVAILASITFIISIIITIWFFVLKRKKCNTINIIMFWVFNFSSAAFSVFPLMSCYDNYLTTMEKIEVYNAAELEPIRKKIRTYYKIIHYVYYALSDAIIPFLTTLYLKRYLAKKEEGKKYKCFSLTILKGFLFFIITILAFAIGAIVIVCVLPEPKLEDLKENTEGWDGLMFNLRNIISLAEYEINILLGAFLFIFKAAYYIRWLFCCCHFKCEDVENGKTNTLLFVYWIIGRLIEKEEPKDDDKLSDFDVAKKELQEERNDYLVDKMLRYYKNDNKILNKCYIPKPIYQVPFGFFFIAFAAFIFVIDINNTFGQATRFDYKNIKSDYEKSSDKEKAKEDILIDFHGFFVFFIVYFITIIYAIITRNYYKEYFPYIGSQHNGYAFLNLLKYMIRIQPPIYFLAFFPHMNKEHTPIISKYFKLVKFTIEKNYWPLIKGVTTIIVAIFCVLLGFTKDGIFKIFREDFSNKYVKAGKDKYDEYQVSDSSEKGIELEISNGKLLPSDA